MNSRLDLTRLRPSEQALSDANSPLAQLKMSSVFYTHSHLSQPWGVTIPAIPNSTMFHLSLNGQARIRIGEHSLALQAGDFILLPHGQGHEIVDSNNSPAVNLFDQDLQKISEHYETLTIEGNGPSSTTLCGTVLFESEISRAILSSMPDYILISNDSEAYPLITTIIQAIQREATNNAYAASLIISKLADILILQSIRVWIAQISENKHGWLMAHTDKRLAPAINQIHGDPAAPINIEQLAKLAGMSRTSFIDYFKKILGQPPKQYIQHWRLSLARELLRHSQRQVIAIALEVGYQSEAAFSRAYKAKFGEPPSQSRRA